MATDRQLATALAKILDGEQGGPPEAIELAAALGRAAAAARFSVAEDDIERALTSVRPLLHPQTRPRRHWLRPVLVVASGVAIAAWLVLGSIGGGRPADVQARALGAITRSGVVEVTERIAPGPAGGFAPSVRSGWFAPGGDAVWTQTVSGGLAEQTLLAGGRITRYDPLSNTATIAGSCSALASGCADTADPVAVYRQALLSAAPGGVQVHRRGSAYELTLPTRQLPAAVRVVQRVTIDARTFLPTRIVWVDPGNRIASVISILSIATVAPADVPPDTFTLVLPPGTRTIQLAAPDQPVQQLSSRPLSLRQAQALRPEPYWLGASYHGNHLTGITLVHYTGDNAVRIRYGRITVWTYRHVVPPSLLATPLIPIKSVVIGKRVVRFYTSTNHHLIVEFDQPTGTVAIVAPLLDKVVLLDVTDHVRPLP